MSADTAPGLPPRPTAAAAAGPKKSGAAGGPPNIPPKSVSMMDLTLYVALPRFPR